MIDGTRLTIRTWPESGTRAWPESGTRASPDPAGFTGTSQAVEQLGLLGRELGLADDAPPAQHVELLDLTRDGRGVDAGP